MCVCVCVEGGGWQDIKAAPLAEVGPSLRYLECLFCCHDYWKIKPIFTQILKEKLDCAVHVDAGENLAGASFTEST